ncbi:hypothetical protein llap_2147 [Limosa lapponica baueri]|uniref:Uncharacterized protein n=1 Tax=Limosa lapponica baueri TaxID=1758121 RepID=A0A2I0UN86_LIMLA|nr:hypothetical protein llap_2147 [Limosa lapponica baueri]
MPAISKMDPLLAKAERVSDGGSTSVRTYLRRGKNLLQWNNSSQRRGVRIHERNNSAETSEEGCVPGAGAKISLQPMVKAMLMDGPTLVQVDAQRSLGENMENLYWRRLMARSVALWKEKLVLEEVRTCDPQVTVWGTHTGAVHE